MREEEEGKTQWKKIKRNYIKTIFVSKKKSKASNVQHTEKNNINVKRRCDVAKDKCLKPVLPRARSNAETIAKFFILYFIYRKTEYI